MDEPSRAALGGAKGASAGARANAGAGTNAGARANTSLRADLELFFRHLRLPFQLLLAPIFLLGAWLAGAHLSWVLFAAFLAVHVGIYGGMTAFNSYYDRDQGPIGFMKEPRPVTPRMRNWAIAVQLAAVAALAARSWPAGLAALLLVAMGIAYSHPRWRWKASLGASMAAVGIGQGILAFLIGYLIARPSAVRAALTPAVAIPALGAALVTLGLYPITQVYQIDEDRKRGDRTLATVLGWRHALIGSALLVPLGAIAIATGLTARILPVWPWLLGAFVVAFWIALGIWARRFEARDSALNHDWAMGIAVAASAGFWIFILLEWRRTGW
jgi:1,4-dihydroxy-2-naphthoate octaprenyltransferase